mmetsp:Transcript_93629/g.270524  ORF Transcript_93629/g.270524 Transcript_93629/m.270524 type:complete len:228 (+) Transcript_93629:458-1141(+)
MDQRPQWQPDELVEFLFGQEAKHHKDRGCVLHRDEAQQRDEVEGEAEDDAPEQGTVPLSLPVRIGVLRHPLQAQRDRAFDPTLLGAQEPFGRLRHAIGQLPVHEVRVLADQHAVQAARGILDLATRVELLALDLLRAQAAVAVAHALQPPLPNGRIVARVELPHAIGAARAHATAAVTDHRVQAEELGVVVIQVIELVLVLGVVLRSLGEADAMVQLTVLMEEARHA